MLTVSFAGAMSGAGCAGGSGKNLGSRTLDHDAVIMTDHDDAVTISHIDEAIINDGDAFLSKIIFFVQSKIYNFHELLCYL